MFAKNATAALKLFAPIKFLSNKCRTDCLEWLRLRLHTSNSISKLNSLINFRFKLFYRATKWFVYKRLSNLLHCITTHECLVHGVWKVERDREDGVTNVYLHLHEYTWNVNIDNKSNVFNLYFLLILIRLPSSQLKHIWLHPIENSIHGCSCSWLWLQ